MQGLHDSHVFQYMALLILLAVDKNGTVAREVLLKGECHEIFCFLFFSWISFPPAPDYHRFEFFRKFAEIFASQGAPPPTGINDTGGKLPPLSTTPAANLPPVSTTPVANFATIFPSVIDTGGKFATGVNDTFKSNLSWIVYI